MSTYLIINIMIILGPLLLSFEKKICYYRKLPALLLSVFLTGVVFVLWDVIAHTRNDWQFNAEHVLPLRLLTLPLEELLFFFTVPYSCIFLYETISLYLSERYYLYRPYPATAAAAVFLTLAVVYSDRYYTFTVCLFCALIFLYSLYRRGIFYRRTFRIFLAASYVPFFIVNYLLTSLPVVTYSPRAITGIKVLTIPAEDFLYSFALLTTYLIIYSESEKIYERIGSWLRFGRDVGSHKNGSLRP